MRNVLAKVSKVHDDMVAATIRTIFAQPGQKQVRAQVDLVATMLTGQFPAVAQMLLDAKTDLTAFADLPLPHWRKIWSTNPLERLNREVKHRTDVVGIFPNPAALLRLSSCVLIEAHDEWQDSDRRKLSEESMALLNPPAPTLLEPKTTTTKTAPRKDRRHGIVAPTHGVTREELHHLAGRDLRLSFDEPPYAAGVTPEDGYQPVQPIGAWPAGELSPAWTEFLVILDQRRATATDESLSRSLNVALRSAALETGAIEGLYASSRGVTRTVALQGAMWEAALDDVGPDVRGHLTHNSKHSNRPLISSRTPDRSVRFGCVNCTP